MTFRGHTEFHSPFNEIKERMATGLRPGTDSTLKPFGQPWNPTEEPETYTRYAILALKVPLFLLEGDNAWALENYYPGSEYQPAYRSS